MNVIFLDFEGVLFTLDEYKKSFDHEHNMPYDEIEKRVKILAEICKEYNCKVVIEASQKTALDEETMEISEWAPWLKRLFNMFKQYGIDCIGRTPEVPRRLSDCAELPMWKEDEIRLYLLRHPEIEHYCVIDDDDAISMLHWKKSDLDKVREHLVVTKNYSENNPEEIALLPSHKEEVGKALQKENEVRRLVQRWKHKVER